MVKIIALMSIVFLASCNKQNERYEVWYQVKGNSGANITYMNDTGGIEQVTIDKLPWYKNYTCLGKHVLTISAQAKDYSSQIKVEILIGNTVIKEAQSQGDFAVASASTVVE